MDMEHPFMQKTAIPYMHGAIEGIHTLLLFSFGIGFVGALIVAVFLCITYVYYFLRVLLLHFIMFSSFLFFLFFIFALAMYTLLPVAFTTMMLGGVLGSFINSIVSLPKIFIYLAVIIGAVVAFSPIFLIINLYERYEDNKIYRSFKNSKFYKYCMTPPKHINLEENKNMDKNKEE